MSEREEIGALRDLVTELLEDYPATRSCDGYLALMVYDRLGLAKGIKARDMSLEEYLLQGRNYGFPSLESITRFRRKAQEENEELKASEHVYRMRWNLAKVIKEAVR